MAGTARTANFLLSSATVMIGDMVDLYDLNPDTHSIGLVKNFTCTTNPTYTDLTQGTRSQVVYSVLTKYDVLAKCEVFEYTASNLSYALGLEGKGIVAPTASSPLAAALTGNTATPVTTATFSSATDQTALWTIGSWIMIQDLLEQDHVHIAKLTAATTKTGTAAPYIHTLTFTGQGLKTGNNFNVGSTVSLVNTLDIGVKNDQPFFSAKVSAVLPSNDQPFTILFPKIRIIKGFNLAFTEAFANLPFEFQPYDMLPGDPFYGTDFPGMSKLFVTT